MTQLCIRTDFTAEGDHLYLPVLWDEADVALERLIDRGIPATLCIDPAKREAVIELPVSVDGEQVRQALSGPA